MINYVGILHFCTKFYIFLTWVRCSLIFLQGYLITGPVLYNLVSISVCTWKRFWLFVMLNVLLVYDVTS